MIIQGEALEKLKTIPSNSVDCCVTSPPYFQLRDYGVEGQIGLEKTVDEYIEKLVDIFREVRRVLKSDGTLWVNIADSYAGSMSNAFKAESAFSRVVNAGIRGADLYILWNDCCGRDTEFALDIMKNRDIEEIKKHIKGEYGRGTPFEKDGK